MPTLLKKKEKTKKKVFTVQVEESLLKRVIKKRKAEGLTMRQVVEYGFVLFLES